MGGAGTSRLAAEGLPQRGDAIGGSAVGQKVAEGFWGKDAREVELKGREVGGRQASVLQRGVGAAEKGVGEGGETEN